MVAFKLQLGLGLPTEMVTQKMVALASRVRISREEGLGLG